MNLGQFRELTKNLPDNTFVFLEGTDHDYRVAHASIGSVLANFKEHVYTEDFGEDKTPEAEFGKRIEALILT